MRVAICGSGPSAAYAVIACKECGVDFEVFSDRSPHFDQSGAFFLHWLPDEFVTRHSIHSVDVWWIGQGSAEQYSKKMWGRVISTSFPVEPRVEKMYYSIALQNVWDSAPVTRQVLHRDELLTLASRFDLVFHSFPIVQRELKLFPVLDRKWSQSRRSIIAYDGTSSHSVRITYTPWRISEEYVLKEHAEMVACRGDEIHMLRDIPPSVEPLSPQDYLASNVIPIGRFATWDRKMLAHDSYKEVKRWIS